MAFHLPTFLTRLGSAIVFSAVMMAGLLFNSWAFIALFFLVNILCLMEYASLIEPILGIQFSRNERMNYVFAGMTLFLTVAALPITLCEDPAALILRAFSFQILGLFIGAVLIFFLFRSNRKSNYLLTGISYISLSLGLLVHIRFESLYLPLILILLIWMNDTMAYLCGSFFGKTPFFPAISPKKTMEGTLGGVLFTMAFAFLWGWNTEWFPLSFWILLALTASVAGTAGDLAESKLKRLAGVKDSGQLMPGHGGALDRFDSLLLAAPFAFLISLWYSICLPVKVF